MNSFPVVIEGGVIINQIHQRLQIAVDFKRMSIKTIKDGEVIDKIDFSNEEFSLNDYTNLINNAVESAKRL